MRKIKVNKLQCGDWFEIDNRIYIFMSVDDDGTYTSVSPLASMYSCIQPQSEVNLDWWEAIAGDEDAPKWLIMKAYQDGAELEFQNNSGVNWFKSIEPDWDWSECKYRVKKSTHTIKIDDKEIELSEESYNNLRESLKD